jgi:ribosomal protein S1
VQLIEGVDGLVHISDLSWTDHVTHPSDRYKKGADVDAMILSIDADNRKVSLGIKQLEKDPWASVASEYTPGSMVEGTVSKVTNFGAFVKLGTGIEGLVHISELADREVEKVEDMLKVGQVASFRVIKVSPEERKLGLSLRPMREASAEEATQQESPAEKAPAKEKRERAPQAPKVAKAPKAASERNEAAQPSAKNAAKEAANAGSGLKGTLQQALEEHAARLKNDSDK